MPHYGTLRETRFEQDADDIRGAEVYGVNDEKLGKIDDVIFDHASGDIRYVVVETGGLFSKKSFLVPANRVSPYGNHEDKFYAELDKERIQMLPEYDENALKSEGHWSEYEKHYQEQWKDGALMYNTSTGRIITPPTEQVSGTGTGHLGGQDRISAQDLTPERVGREDDLFGVGNSRSATLQPKKPSIGGREDAVGRETERAIYTPRTGVREGEVLPEREGLAEPGVYRADRVPDAEKKSDLNEPLNANYGPRWNQFQTRLRERRADMVGECPICGSQRKVA
jgi:sporulation protein YlmC with PRC-barrel domain